MMYATGLDYVAVLGMLGTNWKRNVQTIRSFPALSKIMRQRMGEQNNHLYVLLRS